MAEKVVIGNAELWHGDCLEMLRLMQENSVDSIVTDPPYGLSFMGKRWDYDVPSVEIWAECLRVLKPGGYLLAFAGTRTQHRMAVRIEDAGFEIRDMIAWVYGSGFPKSLDVSKAIAKRAGGDITARDAISFMMARREELGLSRPEFERLIFGRSDGNVRNWEDGISLPKPGLWVDIKRAMGLKTTPFDDAMERGDEVVGCENGSFGYQKDGTRWSEDRVIHAPATEAARQWQGWGTALKPALEPITVARKPLIGTVAENVLAHGTGALNIDGCRVHGGPSAGGSVSGATALGQGSGWNAHKNHATEIDRSMAAGRWPANLIHDGSDEVLAGFPVNAPSGGVTHQPKRSGFAGFKAGRDDGTNVQRAPDTGSAARFFKECKQWQDRSLIQSSAGTVEQSSSLPNHLAATVQNAVAIWPSLAGILSSEQTAAFTPVTLNESKAISETAMQAMSSIASGFSQESQHERLTPCGSLVRTAAIQRPTGTTTITTSLCRSDGSAGVATFTITPSNLDRGEAVFRFNYCAKASKSDRGAENSHPTVKPTDLMAYLVRLVTPPGGVILDPFMGSGSTGKAAMREGFRFIGCELSAEYVAISKARISSYQSHLELMHSNKYHPVQESLFDHP